MNDDEILICRCEEITLRQIRECIAQGFTTLTELRRFLRVGMGPCQGRGCRELLLRELAQATGKPIEELSLPTFRPPAKPVIVGLIGKSPSSDPGSNHERG